MKTKPKTRYGILDDFGDVIRWVWSKPSSSYQFITEKVKEDKINWNDFEQALF